MKTLIIVLLFLVIIPALLAVILIAWVLSYKEPFFNDLNENEDETENK